MAAPSILMYNLENQQKLKLLLVCSKLKILCHDIPMVDYAQPVAALAGERLRTEDVYDGEGFTDEMLVLVNFTNPLLNAFLTSLRQNRVSGMALKAVMTPTNAEWNSIRLHDELVREHAAMHEKANR